MITTISHIYLMANTEELCNVWHFFYLGKSNFWDYNKSNIRFNGALENNRDKGTIYSRNSFHRSQEHTSETWNFYKRENI